MKIKNRNDEKGSLRQTANTEACCVNKCPHMQSLQSLPCPCKNLPEPFGGRLCRSLRPRHIERDVLRQAQACGVDENLAMECALDALSVLHARRRRCRNGELRPNRANLRPPERQGLLARVLHLCRSWSQRVQLRMICIGRHNG